MTEILNFGHAYDLPLQDGGALSVIEIAEAQPVIVPVTEVTGQTSSKKDVIRLINQHYISKENAVNAANFFNKLVEHYEKKEQEAAENADAAAPVKKAKLTKAK